MKNEISNEGLKTAVEICSRNLYSSTAVTETKGDKTWLSSSRMRHVEGHSRIERRNYERVKMRRKQCVDPRPLIAAAKYLHK